MVIFPKTESKKKPKRNESMAICAMVWVIGFLILIGPADTKHISFLCVTSYLSMRTKIVKCRPFARPDLRPRFIIHKLVIEWMETEKISAINSYFM